MRKRFKTISDIRQSLEDGAIGELDCLMETNADGGE